MQDLKADCRNVRRVLSHIKSGQVVGENEGNCICRQIVSTCNRIWRYTFKVELRCAENLQQQRIPFDEEALLSSVVTDKVDISRTELGVPGF